MVVQRLYDYLKSHNITKIALITDTAGFGKDGRTNLKAQARVYGFTLTEDQTYGTNDPDMMMMQLKKIDDSRSRKQLSAGIQIRGQLLWPGI